MIEVERCKHEGYSGSVWSRALIRCSFKASTEAGYCKVHDPDRIKAKSDAKHERWRKEDAERDHQRRIVQKENAALEVVKRIATGVKDPTETARAFIRELDIVIWGDKQ